MPIQQPGRCGGIQGRGVSARCGQGGRRSFKNIVSSAGGGLDRWPSFSSPKFYGSFSVSGITKDSNGSPLSNVTVDLYSESLVWMNRTISDINGNYRFDNIGVGSVRVLATLAGSPEVVGSTIHNLSPV